MSGATSFVTRLEAEQGATLRTLLTEAGYEMGSVQHAVFSAKGENVSVVFYESGKLVVQGKGTPDFREFRLLEVTLGGSSTLTEPWIGADESGKGDYFGPLVTTACALTPDEERFLDRGALGDSKLVTDRNIFAFAETLALLQHETIVIGPKRYNEMYASFRNLNTLLSWAHAKAILALVDRTGTKRVLLDQFCDASVVKRALGPRASDVQLEMRPRAESHPAVGAASILARAAFLNGLARLESVAGMKLPKGAGEPVLTAGRQLVERHGRAILGEVAKLHFKTTDDVLSG